MSRKILFIDRDGTMIKEPPVTFQVDTLNQLELLPGLIRNLYKIQHQLGYELVMVTNQDGLGTASYPLDNFSIIQEKLMSLLRGEGITFSAIHVDESFPHEQSPNRKPGTGMLQAYLDGSCDLRSSFVIGDRITDVQLANNLGTGMLFLRNYDLPPTGDGSPEFIAEYWDEFFLYLKGKSRKTVYNRQTTETNIRIMLNPDGQGQYNIHTGLGFFDHMLEQLARHSGMDLTISANGDLHIDEHHTIEDTGLALGETLAAALGDKRGIERYGYCLPMDDCLAQAAIDFGGRPWLVWNASFNRPFIGDMPTEMFYHFFKSFSDAARCNLHIKAEGTNEHHKIEAIFKSVARAIKMAIQRDSNNMTLPTTKGIL